MLRCEFFGRCETDIRIAGGLVAGGGYLGVERGPGANLVLVREGDDDLYGRWLGWLIDVSVLVNPARLIGQRGLTAETRRPFGFRQGDDFYAESRWAAGGMHVFTYELPDDIDSLFTDLLQHAAATELLLGGRPLCAHDCLTVHPGGPCSHLDHHSTMGHRGMSSLQPNRSSNKDFAVGLARVAGVGRDNYLVAQFDVGY